MNTSDTIFQRALCNLLIEIFEGPPGNEAYLLNPGDPDLLRQLEYIDPRPDRRPENRQLPLMSITFTTDSCS